jgi:hypothetical protein
MSVLDRKMFKRVAKLKHGGDPNINHVTGEPYPSAIPGGYDPIDTSVYQTYNQNKDQTNLPSTEDNLLSGIVSGMYDFYPTAVTMAESLYPSKTTEELAQEASQLFKTDYSAEREAIEAQKQADVASSLITFGARLLTGRGNALKVLGEATQATLPEFTAARRATRKEETAVKAAEKQVDIQKRQYVLSEQQKDEVNRANVVAQAMFSNLGFYQNLVEAQQKNNFELKKTFRIVKDNKTNLNTEVSLDEFLRDMEKPESERKYSKALDYDSPFTVYDNILKTNRYFTNYEEFARANEAQPMRFDNAREFKEPEYIQARNMTTNKIEFIDKNKLDTNVHVPINDINYVEVMDTQNNNKLMYMRKDQPFDTNRYVPKQTAEDLVRSYKMGGFTHPSTQQYTNLPVKIMKDGSVQIPALDKNGDVVLQANGDASWMPIGTGLADLSLGADVALTKEDILPKKALNEQLSTILMYDRNIRSIDKVISNISKDPAIVGLPGVITDIKQRAVGMLADVIAANDDLGISIVTSINENIQNSYKDGMIETAEGSGVFVPVDQVLTHNNEFSQELWGDFKPEIAENRVRIQAIAYAVARARKSSGRLNLDDIKRAYESLKITGTLDSKSVTAGLIAVREELRLANNDLKVLYEFNKGTYPSGYTPVDTSSMTGGAISAYNSETDEIEFILDGDRKQ